jgi:hypothetical protein
LSVSNAVSSGLAVACVTAVLKSVLENSFVQEGLAARLGDAQVSALPPDRVPIGADERSQLNVFLYRITPNTRVRSDRSNGKPDEPAARRKSPLYLDLHYLLTAYGDQDLVAEILLGHAIQVLQSAPSLDADAVRSALGIGGPNGAASLLSPGRAVLASASLADVIGEISIVPEFLGTEELSRIWSALQARYRPSATYKVSAAVIQAE